MNTTELAKRVGISTKTVRKWIKDFDLPCSKNELGHYVFDEKDVELYFEIQNQLKGGTPAVEIDVEKLLPRKGTVKIMRKETDSTDDELSITSLLERVKRTERKLEEKASDVVSYQLLHHRKEIEELQQRVKALEAYIEKMENKVKEERKDISLVLDHQKKPSKLRKIMGFMF